MKKKETEAKEQGTKQVGLEDIYDQVLFVRDSLRAIGNSPELCPFNEAVSEGAAIILDRVADQIAELM